MMVVLVAFLITDDLNQKQGPTLGIKGIPKEEACLHRSSKVQRASNLTIRNALWQKLLPNPPTARASCEKCSTSASSAPHRIHMRSSFYYHLAQTNTKCRTTHEDKNKPTYYAHKLGDCIRSYFNILITVMGLVVICLFFRLCC